MKLAAGKAVAGTAGRFDPRDTGSFIPQDAIRGH
jgi:hypothetical protein